MCGSLLFCLLKYFANRFPTILVQQKQKADKRQKEGSKMKKQNEKKLLTGVKTEEGIDLSVRSLARFMAEEGVVVMPFVGRMRCNIPIPNFGVHVEKMSLSGSHFYEENVGSGFLKFIPREDELELARLERRLRKACEERVLADSFMPIRAYESLREEFHEIRKAYYDKGESLLNRWEDLRDQFETGVCEMLEGVELSEEEKEQVREDIVKQIPEKESYRVFFQMRLKIRAFQSELPANSFEGALSADVAESWREDVVSTAVRSIEKQVTEGWQWIMKGMKRYLKEQRMRPAAVEGLVRFRESLNWKNVFSNPLLKELEELLNGLEEQEDATEQARCMEQAAVAIWGYAKEANLSLPLEGIPYSEEMLDRMLFGQA